MNEEHRTKFERKPLKKPLEQRCGPKGLAQVLPNLYLSGEAFAQRRERLAEFSITHIVACGCHAHFPHDADLTYHEVHLKDSATARVSRLLDPVADFIATGLRARGAVLVHCKAGICRSTTMIIGYLLKFRQDLAPTVEAALAVVKHARPCANPRPEFVEALQAFAGRQQEGCGEGVDRKQSEGDALEAAEGGEAEHSGALEELAEYETELPQADDAEDNAADVRLQPKHRLEQEGDLRTMSVVAAECNEDFVECDTGVHVFKAEWDEEGVYVYQAFCDSIADWAWSTSRWAGRRTTRRE